MTSLPPRERGLKSPRLPIFKIGLFVAPPAGAWIEMRKYRRTVSQRFVAPPAGAWIEMLQMQVSQNDILSLPPRERGLKFLFTI